MDNVDSLKQFGAVLSQLTPSQAAYAVATNGLSKELLEEALLQADVKHEMIASIIQHYDAAQAKIVDKAATDKLNVSLRNVGVAIGANIKKTAVWLAFDPVGRIVAIAGVIAAVAGALYLNNKRIEETIQKSKELQDAYHENQKAIQDNLSSVRALDHEFSILAKGVDEYGNNITLTTDEYEKYRDIVQQLVDINPTLVQGYTDEGQAIIDKNVAIQDTIDLLKQQQRLELNNATTDDNNWDIADGAIEQYVKDAEKARDAQKEMFKALTDGLDEVGALYGSYTGTPEIEQAISELERVLGLVDDVEGQHLDQRIGQMVAELQTGGYDMAEILAQNEGLFAQMLSQNTSAMSNFAQSVNAFMAATAQAEKAAKGYQSHMATIAQASSGYEELNDASRKLIGEWISAQKLTGEEAKEDVAEIVTRIREMVWALADDPSLQAQANSLFSVDLDNLAGGFYSQAYEEAAAALDALKNNKLITAEDYIELSLAVGLTIIDPETGEPVNPRTYYYQKLSEAGMVTGDGGVNLDGFTNEELRILLNADVHGIDTIEECNVILEESRHKAEEAANSLDSVATAFSKLESITKDRESITEVLDAFAAGTGDAKLAANMKKIIEAFPHLRDEIGLYSSGMITAEELQNEFNKALAGFDADNIYDGVNDIADAVETYGKDSYQVIQAVQDLEAAVPGLTGVLYDAETGMLKVDVAAYETEQSLYGVLKAAIKTEYEAKRLDLSNAITELEDLRDAAIETAAGLRNVENQRVYNAFASYTGDIDAKKAELEALTQWYNGILGELNAADGRYDRTTDAHKEAFEKEYDTHKHKVAMEQETEAEFYAWLEDANERYFANSKKYLGEYRKYKEEVFNGLREVMDDALADEEHQISLLDNAGGNKAEIVKHYRNMQDIVHQAADSIRADMRAAGMSEEEIANSDIIQDLQTKWWSYRDNIKDALSSIDKDLEEHLTFAEHEIYLLEQQEGHEDQIIAKYLQLQNKVHEAADEIRDDLRELGYTEEGIAKNGAVMELQKKWWEYNDAIKETVETLNEDMHDSLESLLDLTVEMIKQEKEDEKEVLEDLKDDYKDLIEARKKMLELTKKESEYTEDVEEKTRKLAKIEEKLAKLKLDDSRTARIEEEKLKEEQLELQKELNKIQREHYHDEAEAALDDELEMFEKTQDDKIDEIEDYLDAEGQLRQDALNKLSDMNETLYDQLTAYAKKYTDTSGMELQKMWDDALEAAQRYGDYTAALENTNKEIDMQNVYKESARVIINEMRTNAANWATASDPQALADRNMDLAEQLADAFKMAGVSATITRDHAGVWWINNEKLFEYKFHSGTASVGGKPSKKQNETFALLDNTEMVLTQKHQNNLWNMLSAWAPIASLKSSLSGLSIAGVTKTPAMAGGPNITIEAPLYLTGNVDDATLRAMKKYKNELSEMVSAQLKKL